MKRNFIAGGIGLTFLLIGAFIIWDTGPPTPIVGPMSPPPVPPVTAGPVEPVECDFTVGPEIVRIGGSDVDPGDVVCLEAGERSPLILEGLEGTADDPVIVINHSGVTTIAGTGDDYAGINIKSSSHVVITGAGDSTSCGALFGPDEQNCGIVVRGTGRGLAATARSGDIGVDHVEISDTIHSGIFMRSSASNGTTRAWTQQNTHVEDSYVHDTGTEGLYIGSSRYAEGLDPLLEGVAVSRNLVVDTGWDGIQVGSAVEGCEIANNRVIGPGTQRTENQRTGIIANRGSSCDILGNLVTAPAAQGIYVQGNGGHLVANNLVVNPGAGVPHEGDGITISRGSNEGRSIAVVHNTLVGATRSGIRFRNDVGSDNLIGYNLIVGAPEAIHFERGMVDVDTNVVVNGLEEAGFVDPGSSQFGLKSSSIALDVGPAGDLTVASDLAGNSRPQGAGLDAGAFERVVDP